MLIAEHQHRMLHERPVQSLAQRCIDGLCQVDTADLGSGM
jgi:hypothetical protein